MIEKHPLTNDRTPAPDHDWVSLVERALDDGARILRAELEMFQTGVREAIEARIDSVVLRLMTIIATIMAMFCGALCILLALILLLHQWLPWWQACGIVGVATVAAAIVSHAVTRSAAR